MVLIIDPQVAGISGDMLLSALINIGANKSKVINGIHTSENYLPGSKIQKADFEKIVKHGTEATQIILDIKENTHERRGTDIQECILLTSDKIGLSEQAKEELTTPTGASLLVNLADSCSEFYPSIRVKSIGYGAGKKNFDGFPNVLKIVQAEKIDQFQQDTVQILETNLDDVSGEVLGHMIDKIIANGAKDVTVAPAITKKGRPTNLVSVICDSSSVNAVLNTLISETVTLGIRIRSSTRFVVPRVIISVPVIIHGKSFTVRCKMVKNQDLVQHFKVEALDVKSVADSLSISFKDANEFIRTEIKQKLNLK